MWPFSKKSDPIEVQLSKIFGKAIEGVETVRKFSEDKSVDQSKYGLSQVEWISVFCEFQNFYHHLTARFIYGRLSGDKRSELIELERLSLDTSVGVICKGRTPDTIEKIKEEWWHNFQVSTQEYAKFKKLFPEKGEPIEGTLFWEFGKLIAELSGNGRDIAYIMLGSKLAVNALKEFQLDRLMEKITNDNSTVSNK